MTASPPDRLALSQTNQESKKGANVPVLGHDMMFDIRIPRVPVPGMCTRFLN